MTNEIYLVTIGTMRFIGYDSVKTRIFMLPLPNWHNNVASNVEKNRSSKSHRVIVALGEESV